MHEDEQNKTEAQRERARAVEHLRHQAAEAERLAGVAPGAPGYRHDLGPLHLEAVADALRTAADWIERGEGPAGAAATR